jgi:hypothetical protein
MEVAPGCEPVIVGLEVIIAAVYWNVTHGGYREEIRQTRRLFAMTRNFWLAYWFDRRLSDSQTCWLPC